MQMCLVWAQARPSSMQQTHRNCLHLPTLLKQVRKLSASCKQSGLPTEHSQPSSYKTIAFIPHLHQQLSGYSIHWKWQCGRETGLIPFCNWGTYLLPHRNWRKGFLSSVGSHCSTLHWIIKQWLSQKETISQPKAKKWAGLPNIWTPASAASTSLGL